MIQGDHFDIRVRVYPFTQERIDEQARNNVNVLILGSIAYAKAHGQGGRHWATFMGQAVAST